MKCRFVTEQNMILQVLLICSGQHDCPCRVNLQLVKHMDMIFHVAKHFHTVDFSKFNSPLSGRVDALGLHFQTLPSLHLRHTSFYNSSVASPTSHLILQFFRRFTYVTAHSTNLLSLHLRHRSYYNSSVASPTSQHILQPFRRLAYVTAQSTNLPRFTYVTAYSRTLPSLYLRHKTFFDPFIASSTSQLIVQPLRCFTYVTSYSSKSKLYKWM